MREGEPIPEEAVGVKKTPEATREKNQKAIEEYRSAIKFAQEEIARLQSGQGSKRFSRAISEPGRWIEAYQADIVRYEQTIGIIEKASDEGREMTQEEFNSTFG